MRTDLEAAEILDKCKGFSLRNLHEDIRDAHLDECTNYLVLETYKAKSRKVDIVNLRFFLLHYLEKEKLLQRKDRGKIPQIVGLSAANKDGEITEDFALDQAAYKDYQNRVDEIRDKEDKPESEDIKKLLLKKFMPEIADKIIDELCPLIPMSSITNKYGLKQHHAKMKELLNGKKDATIPVQRNRVYPGDIPNRGHNRAPAQNDERGDKRLFYSADSSCRLQLYLADKLYNKYCHSRSKVCNVNKRAGEGWGAIKKARCLLTQSALYHNKMSVAADILGFSMRAIRNDISEYAREGILFFLFLRPQYLYMHTSNPYIIDFFNRGNANIHTLARIYKGTK